MQIGRARRRIGLRTSSPAAADLQASACGAPHASMYFAPDGQVRACCVNTAHTLGRIGPQTIREVWEGARLAALRQALDRHDYSLGCQDCEHRVAAGDRAWSTAAQYDPYLLDDPGEFPRRMDFILSITCNLQCAMCDGELSSSIRLHREKRPPMPPAYGDAFFEELREFLPHLERSVFLGGEPFVAREPQRVWDLMIEQGHTAPVQVVTNGTQWNRRVERFLGELPMSITVSIDGWSAGTLEPLRVGVDRDQLFANVDRYQAAVAANGGTLSFHYCLMRQNWHEFGAFLLDADRRGVRALVMTVTGPAGFSLWDLPEDALRRVLDALEAEDRTLGPRLGLNRATWDAELARIRRHLAAIEDGHLPSWVTTSWAPDESSVAVAPRRATLDDTEGLAREHDEATAATASGWPVPATAAQVAAEHEADLARWSGRSPVVLRARDGVVASVEDQPWAAPLAAADLVGVVVADLAQVLGARLGAPSEPVLSIEADGSVGADTTFAHPGGAIVVRTWATPSGPNGELRLALATDAAPELLAPVAG